MTSTFRIRCLWTALILSMPVIGGGCALWTTGKVTHAVGKSPLKQVTPTLDAIELEVSFVERPIVDPLLGNGLWSELDTVSTLDPAAATALRRNGFRYGVAGSQPPRSLEAAMGVAGGNYTGHRYSQRSGEAMTIEAWPAYATCQISLDESGRQRQRTYEQARCMFRVTPQRVQDGWVRLEFIPEIHHGEMQIRPVPGPQDWQQVPSQLIDPLFDQRFLVELNLGEMIVLSADGDDRESVGHHFFCGGTTDNRLQRLLIIRLAGMQRLDPVYE